MQKLPTPNAPITNAPTAPTARRQAGAPPRPNRPRTGLCPRHLEAQAVAWLRSLRDRERPRSGS
jgi:hypothetical protein